MALTITAWIAAAETPRTSHPDDQEHRVSPRRERVIVAGLTFLFAVHAAAALVAVHGEWRYRFSAAETTAALMRSRGVDELEVVGARDVTAMAVVGYLDKPRAYYPAGRRFGSHIVYDTARLAPSSVWVEAWKLAATLGAPVSIVGDLGTLRGELSPPLLLSRLSVGCETSGIQADESYCVLVLVP